MAIVAGVDFGTLSVRVTLFDSSRAVLQKGGLATALASYPLKRKREDPDFATQSHDDQMNALVSAMREVLVEAGISGDQVEAVALDTTGSSVIPVGAPISSRSMTTISGATIAPSAKRTRLLNSPTPSTWRRSSGAGGCIPTSGVSPSCCTGCATIRRNVVSWQVPSSIATWWRRPCAGLPTGSW